MKAQAQKFVDACKAAGFVPVIASDSVVRVVKRFAAGDTDAFVTCDMQGPGLLGLVPLRGGSVWGTDGGGMGGHAAINQGQYTLNKSGTGKRFIAALRSLVG